MTLKDKTIFITGATSGLGRAFATRFLREGARIVALGRRGNRLRALQEESGSKRLQTLCLDIRDKAALADALQRLPAAFQAIDILINNAGLALGFDPAQTSALADWEAMVDTNIKGVLYCTHALLPGMVARDSGHIVNIGSIAGTYPYPNSNVYGATKAFLKQFSLNLRADLLGSQVRVTNIEPGMVETEFSLVRFKGSEEKAGKIYADMQALSAEDIAESVLFCLTRPAHVNINALEIMPTMQAFSAFAVHRGKPS